MVQGYLITYDVVGNDVFYRGESINSPRNVKMGAGRAWEKDGQNDIPGSWGASQMFSKCLV